MSDKKCAYCNGKYGKASTYSGGLPSCASCAKARKFTKNQREIGVAVVGAIKDNK